MRGRKYLISDDLLPNFVGRLAQTLHSSSERLVSSPLELLRDRNVIVLGNVRTHLIELVAGTVMNAALFLRPARERWPFIMKPRDICGRFRALKKEARSLLGVLDGTFAGDGAGPRCLRIFTKNFILASRDLVALDAVAAKAMGFDPMSVSYLKVLHDEGLGCADIKKIKVIGDGIAGTDFRFSIIASHFSRFFERAVRRFELNDDRRSKQPFLAASFLECMQDIYFKTIWLKKTGKFRLSLAADSAWGKLLRQYGLMLS